MTHHTVVWDGRRQGPGGAYLAAEVEAVVAATAAPHPPQQPRQSSGDVGRLVLVSLQGGPKTLRELVDDTGLSMDRVNEALYVLQRYRDVERVGERPCETGGAWGRQLAFVYGVRG
jgi:hypothetical protein